MNKISETRLASEPAGDDATMSQDDNRPLKYYDLLTVLAATVGVCTNILALKVARVGPFDFSAAVIFFPIAYILGDVLTEVYGFKRARRSIWLSFGAMLFAAVMSWAVLRLPPAPDKLETQQHFEAVFTATPRILGASFLAYLVGDLLNSIVLARLKVIDRGRGFWKRAILSTIVGQAADTLIFYPLAFSGIWEWGRIGRIMAFQYCVKVGIEVIGVPFSSWLVAFLKRAEGVDYYDRKTDFNPFGLSVEASDDMRKQ